MELSTETIKKIQDTLVNDLERIERAKRILKDNNSLERDKRESIALLSLYKEIIKNDDSERANEIRKYL